MSHPAIITGLAAAKFEFDREFSRGAVIQPRRERKKTKWTEAEVEALKAEAFRMGEDQARTSEEAEVSRQIAAGAQRVGEQLSALMQSLHEDRAQMRAEAADIALTIARKLMPTLMKQAPVAEIEAVVTDALALLRDEPRVVVTVTPEQLTMLEDRINEMTRDQGFEGQLALRTDEAIAPGDVRIEWARGAITRDTPALDQSIEEIVRTYLSAPSDDGTDQADFFALLGK